MPRTGMRMSTWKSLLIKCSEQELRKICQRVDKEYKEGGPKYSQIELINKIIENTISTKQLLSYKALSKNLLYKYLRNNGVTVDWKMQRKELVTIIQKNWATSQTNELPRLQDHERRECKKILELLPKESISKLCADLHITKDQMDVKMTLLRQIPHVSWLLNKKFVTISILNDYLIDAKVAPNKSVSKRLIVKAVMEHINSQYEQRSCQQTLGLKYAMAGPSNAASNQDAQGTETPRRKLKPMMKIKETVYLYPHGFLK